MEKNELELMLLMSAGDPSRRSGGLLRTSSIPPSPSLSSAATLTTVDAKLYNKLVSRLNEQECKQAANKDIRYIHLVHQPLIVPGQLNVRGCPVLHLFMLSVMSPVVELRSLLANVVRWYRSLYKIMYNLEILPLHAWILHLKRLRTWAKAFVAWAVLNIWLPGWHYPHLHPT
jgi:hypothetical protein